MGGSDLTATDLRAILQIVGSAHETTTVSEFADVLMRNLSTLVGCDLISYNEIDLVGGATTTYFEPALRPRPEVEQAFARLIEQHPLVRDYAQTGDPLPRRLSDFISTSSLQRLDLYHEVFRPLETNHQLAFSLAISTDVVVGIGLNRWRRDFSDRDMAVMSVLQPHLHAAYDHVRLKAAQANQAARDAGLAGLLDVLTPREREVAALIAAGSTNRQIGRALAISDRTAEKHAARVLAKLGVTSRVALAALLAARPS